MVLQAVKTLGKPFYYFLVSICILLPFLVLFVGIPHVFDWVFQHTRSFFFSFATTSSQLFAQRGLAISLSSTAILLLFSAAFYYFILKDLPYPRELVTRDQIVTTKIYDRNGILLYKIYKDENRTLVPLSSIPDSLKYATISIEDRGFYQHGGFSLSGIFRALWANLQGKKVQGGSTITQQLVKKHTAHT
jgi:membrane peptidoglycan carboxypeptidase